MLREMSFPRRRDLEGVSIALEYGFLVDNTLIAMDLKAAGEELPQSLITSMENCQKFLTDLGQIEKDYPASLFTSDRRLLQVLSQGDVHEALGLGVADKDQVIAKLADFAAVLGRVREGEQIELDQYKEMTKFLDNFGRIQLIKTGVLLRSGSF